jgi:hypothetical protein
MGLHGLEQGYLYLLYYVGHVNGHRSIYDTQRLGNWLEISCSQLARLSRILPSFKLHLKTEADLASETFPILNITKTTASAHHTICIRMVYIVGYKIYTYSLETGPG